MEDCSSHDDESEAESDKDRLVVQNCLGFGLRIFRNNTVFAKCPVQICAAESVTWGDEASGVQAGMSVNDMGHTWREMLTTNTR